MKMNELQLPAATCSVSPTERSGGKLLVQFKRWPDSATRYVGGKTTFKSYAKLEIVEQGGRRKEKLMDGNM